MLRSISFCRTSSLKVGTIGIGALDNRSTNLLVKGGYGVSWLARVSFNTNTHAFETAKRSVGSP